MALIRSEATGEARRFHRSLRVGRAPDNDLVLQQTTVSGFHACIQWREGGYYLKDLGSSNGTTLGGESVSGWVQVQAGAVVGFGPDSRWTLEQLDLPRQAGTAIHLVESLDGGPQHPVSEDRLTFGRGPECDVSAEAGPTGLHAVLYHEDEQVFLTPVGPTPVSVAGTSVDGANPAPLEPGATFSVGARHYRFVLNTTVTAALAATARPGVTSRTYGGYQLRLVDRGDVGDIVVRDARGEHRFEDQELKFSLLQVLARELVEQAGSVVENPGWMNDERLRLGIWGRRALENQATSTLAKLIHDTRAMFGKRGIDGLFIEKKRGRTRLRLAAGSVALE
jgi:hypothetical protein